MNDWKDWNTSVGIDRAKEIMGGLVSVNEEERKNGWTDEKLTIYLAERKQSELGKLYPKMKKPNKTKSRMRWLRR